MRLIDIGEFPTIRFREVADPRSVCYAILSHVWNKPGDDGFVREPSFKDLSTLITPSGTLSPDDPVYDKLRRFCEVAYLQGYTLIWADMCCIDKTSSAELSEAIASMYNWYRWADVCYAYLKDVSSSANPSMDPELVLLDSGWFKRGWTLQELVAPRALAFFDKDWTALGTKSSLANHIMSITHIHRDVLTHKQSVHEVSVAQRMSWAAGRETTRPEDQAYCLMGLFGVRIPVMYGEGTYAFIRLQEEILRSIPDSSLLAWGKHSSDLSSLGFHMRVDSPLSPTSVQGSVHILPPPSAIHVDRYFLAASPDDFVLGGYGSLSIRPAEQHPSKPPKPFPFQIVPCHILRMRAPIIPLYSAKSLASGEKQTSPVAFLVMLECQTHTGKSLALLLSIGNSSGQPFYYVGNQTASLESGESRDLSVTRIVTLDPEETSEVEPRTVVDVYVPVSAPRSVGDSAHTATIHRALCQNTGDFRIKVPGWCPVTLAASQYFLAISPTDPHTHLLSLPVGYETCPHNPSESERCEVAAASPSGRCPDSSGVLRITFANCKSSSCGTYWRDSKAHYLWGDIQVDATPSQTSTDTQAAARTACRGAQHHIASESWTLRDGVASKPFTFRIRKMQDGTPPNGAAGAIVNGRVLPPPARTQTIQVTLALKRMPSDRLDGPHTFLLEVDVSKLSQSAATPAPSPTRNQGLDLHLLIPDPTSLAADRQKQSPLTARRRNSIVTLSRTTSAAGEADPSPASAPQRRVRSTSLSREPSAAPSLPSGSSAVPIIITPSPLMRPKDIEVSPPTPPTSPVRPAPPAPPRLPPPAPSPSPPSPIYYTASAPAAQPASGPSTQPAPPQNNAPATEDEPVHAPNTRNDQGRSAAATFKGSRTRTEDSPHPRVAPVRNRVAKAAMSRIRRVMSKLGRSRPENRGVGARAAGVPRPLDGAS